MSAAACAALVRPPLPLTLARAERGVAHDFVSPGAEAAAEESVGIDDDEAWPKIEASEDPFQRELVRLAKAEPQHVVAQAAGVEERPQLLGTQREHQPRVAEEQHLGCLEVAQGRTVGAEVEDVVIDVPADVVGQVVIAVLWPRAGVGIGAQ
ncbi:MAG: hypothetical protein U0P30_07800 [Vicinamibacterales bacterium]